ncbi:MAG: ATP-binding protein [Alphaproteobacteria bacterium]|nr:ATP-binding protein [Alphaproteobacteria bacterium]
MKEIVVISGKGGTGKTSLMASFALLDGKSVLADCDVDAADLHLLLSPKIKETREFWSGHEAEIMPDKCIQCGACRMLCRFDAIRETPGSGGESFYRVDPTACEGCGACVRFCPKGAVVFKERLCGTWMISETRAGPMVHARLGLAAENSGKLVSLVRQEAKKLALSEGRQTVLIDGPPGIGCPVIASVSGAAAVIVVTEPTLSGEHDLGRALGLAAHFKIPAYVCINKWDICPDMASRIEVSAHAAGAVVLGRIRYDASITKAQKAFKAVVETDAPSAADIEKVWETFLQHQAEKENRS